MAEEWKATSTEPNQYGETIIVDEHGEGICGVYHREDVPTILAAPLLYEAVADLFRQSSILHSDEEFVSVSMTKELWETLRAARDKAEE